MWNYDIIWKSRTFMDKSFFLKIEPLPAAFFFFSSFQYSL